MTYPFSVKDDKPFRQLSGNDSSHFLGLGTVVYEKLIEVAVFAIFHRDVDTLSVIIPTEKLDEVLIVLW